MVSIKINLTIEHDIPNPFNALNKINPHQAIANIASRIGTAEECVTTSLSQWRDRAITAIDNSRIRMDHLIPSNRMQKMLDSFYEEKVAPLLNSTDAAEFREWLYSNGHGQWYQRLGVALAKTPHRLGYNIMCHVYSILKALIYTAVHPIRSVHDAAAYFVNFLHSLTLPETWTKIGAGMVGVSLGYSLVGFPVSALGVGLGITLMATGIAYEAIRTAAKAQKGQKWQSVIDMLVDKHIQHVPLALTTGLFSGVYLGAAQKLMSIPTQAEVQQYVDSFKNPYRYGYWTYYLRTNEIEFWWGSIEMPVKVVPNLNLPAHIATQASILTSDK